MKPAQNVPPIQAIHHRKTRDRALILPLVGLFLLLPPFAGVFELEVRVAGVPLTALYLFVVWALLIAGAAALSRPLLEGTGHNPADDSRD